MDNVKWKIEKALSPKSHKTFWGVEGELRIKEVVKFQVKNDRAVSR